ncbi:MAG: twin-arginine translocase subunit TatC [Planctomycetota bacterium]
MAEVKRIADKGAAKQRVDAPNDRRMTFGEHLEELRRRVLVSLVGILVLFVLALIFQDFLFHVASIPYDRARQILAAKGVQVGNLVAIRPTDGFVVHMQVCLAAAVLLGAPLFLHQMWVFIGAGLYPKERRAVMRVLPFSLLLFAVGCVFSFTLLLPFGLQFLMGYSPKIDAQNSVAEYFKLVVALTLIMGLIFQLPLVMLVLARTGIVQRETFSKQRRIFILAAFVLAAVVTPPDVISQLFVAVPMVGLYELGILLVRARREQAAVPARTGSADAPRSGEPRGGEQGVSLSSDPPSHH